MVVPASYRGILKTWFPLLLTWLLMAIEGPFLGSLIARLPKAKENLAAFGIAFAVALLLESPIINMLAASVKVVSDRNSYRILRNFNFCLSALLTILTAIVLIPSVFELWSEKFLHLDPEVSALSRMALLTLLPWPAAIGYRRLYQGILIKAGRSRLVTFGTICRLFSGFGVAICLYKFMDFSGAVLGGISLSVGVVSEAVITRMLVKRTLSSLCSAPVHGSSWTFKSLVVFYYPLALTTFIGLAIAPMTSFAAGRGIAPLDSLAVLPVLNAFLFIFRAVALSMQEVIISLLEKAKNQMAMLLKLQKFVLGLGIFCSICYFVMALTPLYFYWFQSVLGLSHKLASFARESVFFTCLIPPFTMLLNWQRSILISRKMTLPISYSSAIELLVVATTLAIGISFELATAVTVVMFGLSTSRVISTCYLAFVIGGDRSQRLLVAGG